jgi:hypothetical protein
MPTNDDTSGGFFNIQSLQGLINDLGLALDWLRGHGIERCQTRFGTYEKTLKMVLEHRAAGTEDLLSNLVSASEYGYAFIETIDLTNIHRVLGKWRNQTFIEKLRQAVKGSDDPRQERPLGANARDTLFELGALAYFRGFQIPVLIKAEGDGLLRFDRQRLLIESKRIRSKKRLEKAVEKAVSQLKERFKKSDRESYGLICLDASLVLNEKQQFLVPPSYRELAEMLTHMMAEFAVESKRCLKPVVGREMLGTMIFLKLPGYDFPSGRYLSILKTHLVFSGVPGSTPEFLAQKLHKTLQQPTLLRGKYQIPSGEGNSSGHSV